MNPVYRATLLKIIPAMLLVILGVSVYADSLSYQLLNWDDPAYITHNELIRGWSAENLKGIATEVVTRNYAPVTIFSFLIDHTLWGMEPSGFRLTNIILHLLNGVLAFLLLKRLGCHALVSWIAAALFLVHPVQIESVVWISSRKGLLCTVFMLAAGLVRMRPDSRGRHDAWYVLWLSLALLSKAQAVVLAPIVLLYDILIARRSWAESIPRHFIPALVSVLLLLQTIGAQNTVLGGVRGHMNLGLLRILAVDVTILWTYVGMLIWPQNLCVMYDPPVQGIGLQVALGLGGWAVVAWLVHRCGRKHPSVLFGVFSILLLLFPMLNILPITTLMNDRYLYLPSLIVFALFAGGLRNVLSEGHRLRILRTGLCSLGASLALGGALIQSASYLPVWSSAFDLWTHAISLYPNLPIARIQMALHEHDSGRIRTAIEQMRSALAECQPDELDRERMIGFIAEWSRELENHQLSPVPSHISLDDTSTGRRQ